MEQLTSTTALDRHQEKQQQLIVMEERATIASELHDSIAQSLSCMKMQVSCLQMQGDALPTESRQLLGQIRNELNTSWAQLRELLTTFRLQLTEPGLRPALEASCQEYSAHFGFTVQLDYQLPPRFCALASGDPPAADRSRSVEQRSEACQRDRSDRDGVTTR